MRAFIVGLWFKGMIVTGPVLAGTIPEAGTMGVGVLKPAELGSGLFCAAGASCTGGGADSAVAAPWGSSLNIEDANLADESSPSVSSELTSRDGAADLSTSATTALFGIGLIALGISRRQRSASC